VIKFRHIPPPIDLIISWFELFPKKILAKLFSDKLTAFGSGNIRVVRLYDVAAIFLE
jgi:hypothetical protein